EKPAADRIIHKNDWNHYYVRAHGHHIQIWLNGVRTVDVVDDKGGLTGSIGFQLCHGAGQKTAASFKNVFLRPLPHVPSAGVGGPVDEATKQRIDRWIKEHNLNPYGDPKDTMYIGG